MEQGILEIFDHEGEGYKPLVDYGEWRVAILRFEDGLEPGGQLNMERHIETDEVFVLTKGEGVLITGGNGPRVDNLARQAMEIGKVYNVRKNAWHTVSLSRDASVLIVENRNTTPENSESMDLSEEQRRWLEQTMHAEG